MTCQALKNKPLPLFFWDDKYSQCRRPKCICEFSYICAFCRKRLLLMMQFSLILFNSSCVNLFPDRFSREVSGFGALQGAFHPNHDPHLPIQGWSAKFSHVLFHKLKMFGGKKVVWIRNIHLGSHLFYQSCSSETHEKLPDTRRVQFLPATPQITQEGPCWTGTAICV